jgi:hypothetical protein
MDNQAKDALATYVADLTELADRAEQRAKGPQHGPDELARFFEDAAPLLERLKVLTAAIPPDAAQAGIAIEWFRVRLRGRRGRGARAGEVADCLRQLGWTRRRSWRDQEDGFRARWFPPAD